MNPHSHPNSFYRGHQCSWPPPKPTVSVNCFIRLATGLLDLLECVWLALIFKGFVGTAKSSCDHFCRKFISLKKHCFQPVWPDVGIRSSPIYTNCCPKSSHRILQNRPKVNQIVGPTFVRQLIARNFKKSPNPVTLLSTLPRSSYIKFPLHGSQNCFVIKWPQDLKLCKPISPIHFIFGSYNHDNSLKLETRKQVWCLPVIRNSMRLGTGFYSNCLYKIFRKIK